MGIYRCHVHDRTRSLRSFYASRTKRQSKRLFRIYADPPHLPCRLLRCSRRYKDKHLFRKQATVGSIFCVIHDKHGLHSTHATNAKKNVQTWLWDETRTELPGKTGCFRPQHSPFSTPKRATLQALITDNVTHCDRIHCANKPLLRKTFTLTDRPPARRVMAEQKRTARQAPANDAPSPCRQPLRPPALPCNG